MISKQYFESVRGGYQVPALDKLKLTVAEGNAVKNILNRLEEIVLLITFPLMTVITLMGTTVRYFELGTMTWSEEAARYLMIIAAFAGISLGFRENSHLGLSFFMDVMPEKLKPFFRVFRFIILILFSVLMIFLAYQLVVIQMNVSQFSAAMHISMWKVYAVLLLGFILMLVRIVQAFLKHTEDKQEVL